MFSIREFWVFGICLCSIVAFEEQQTVFTSRLNYIPYVLMCSTFLVPYVSSCLKCFVPYVLSCLTSIVPYLLLFPTCLVPCMFSRLTCLAPYILSCLTRFVPNVLSFPTCLVPYVLSCPTCSRALRAFCLTCLESCVPRAKRALMSHVSHVMLYLTCLVPCVFLGCLLVGILRPPVLLVPHLLQVFQPNMLLYTSHVL